MPALTKKRPRAAALRNQRGAVGEQSLSARRERDCLAALDAEQVPQRQLWIVWRWVLAACKRRPDRANAARVVLIRLARELSGSADQTLIQLAHDLAEEGPR